MSGLGSLVLCLHNKLTLRSSSRLRLTPMSAGLMVTPTSSFLHVGTCALSPPVDCQLRREHHFNAKYFLRKVKDLAAKIFLSSDNYTKMDTWIRAGGDMVRINIIELR